jgi:hypothetical protein
MARRDRKRRTFEGSRRAEPVAFPLEKFGPIQASSDGSSFFFSLPVVPYLFGFAKPILGGANLAMKIVRQVCRRE